VTVNLSAALEKLVGDPSYRPTINVPWYVGMLGAFGAIFVMFLINPFACLAAAVLELALYVFLRRRSLKKRWGDVRAGLWVALARFALLRLRSHASNPRNWRPHILLFVGDTAKRIGLVRLAGWFDQNRGLVTACQLIVGDLKQESVDIKRIQLVMDRALEREGLVAFSEVNVVSEFESGIINITQAKGIAGLKSNTVIFGWPRKRERLESQLRVMRAISNAGKSTLIARLNWAHEPGQKKRIDLWWRGKQRNGDLMLLLAYLLNLNPDWNDANIVVRSIVDSETKRRSMASSLAALIPEARIQAETEIIIKPRNRTIAQVIHNHSRNADIVFLGLMDPEPGTESQYTDRLIELASGLNTTVFVRNAGEFAGQLI
jgi:hypothetical protein